MYEQIVVKHGNGYIVFISVLNTMVNAVVFPPPYSFQH